VYWQSKGYNPTAIHAKLVTRFHEKAAAYSSTIDWLRRVHFGEDILEPRIHSGSRSDSFADFKILIESTVFPFHRVHTMVGIPKIPGSTRWHHLQRGTGFLNIYG
jgi:hypothetical protein